MRKILIIGSNGLLGQKAVAACQNQFPVETAGIEPHSVIDFGLPYHRLDITRLLDLEKAVAQLQPEIIFNAAAYTQVDRAEVERELCYAINVTGVKNLAEICARHRLLLVHFSTDYVFDGVKGNYIESDEPNPLSYYARCKLQSEQVVQESGCPFLLERTAVLYGNGIQIQSNFPLWVIQQLTAGKSIRVVDDQIGNPTIADYLAETTRELLIKNAQGLFHVAGTDAVSRYDFAVAVAQKFHCDQSLIVRIQSRDLSQPAPRPLNASLSVEKVQTTYGVKLYSLAQGLTQLLATRGK